MRSGSLAYLLTLATDDTSVPDAELLARFAGNGDATAFELLVRRHADLVWRVCRCELPHDAHSAEDAFQTTFLVLARKAGSVRGSSVAGYLFRVARNAALRVRKRVGNVAEATVEIGVEPAEPNECSVAVIEEVERLPDKFRLPVLLCFFEDCTHVEAANRLGWAVGTVASRLARAKDRLRIRLTHRGMALPAILSGVSVPAATVRAAVMMTTTPSAVPTLLAELTREVSIVMANAKAKWIGGGLLAALILTSGVGMMARTAGPGREEPKPAAKDKSVAKAPVPETPEAAELKKLQGVWRVTKLEVGKDVAPAIEPMRWEFVGDAVSTIDGPADNQKMQVVLDLTKSPKQMTLTAIKKPGLKPEEANITDKLEVIYEFKGGTLRICSSAPGTTFPTEFEAVKGKDTWLIELERIPEKVKPEDAELKKLQGKWKVTRLETESGVVPAEVVKLMRCEFVGDTVLSFTTPDESQKMRVVLDPTKSPKRITLTGQRAHNFPFKNEGIYELKDDTLRCCMSGTGKPIPTEFKAVKGADTDVIELERIYDGIRNLKDLAGEWKFTAGGKPNDSATVDIHRDVIWMTHEDKTEKAHISLDVEKGFFDVTLITEPPAAPGKPLLGRFTWKDGELTVYSGAPGAERPAEAKAGKGVTVAVMVRAVKK